MIEHASTNRTLRRVMAIAVATTFVVASCGSNDPAASPPTDPAPLATAPAATDGADVTDPAPSTDTASTDGADAAGFPLTLTDASGTEHTFDQPVTRIGCRYYGCIESLADMGLVPYAAPAGDDAITFLYPFGQPTVLIDDYDNLEEWAAAEVDVMIELVSPTAIEDAETLGKAAPVFYLNAPYEVWDADHFRPGIEAWSDDLQKLGAMTGESDLADAAIARFDTFLTNLKAAAPADAADTEVANLSFTDDGTYSLMDPKSPFCEALSSNALGHCLDVDGWSSESWEINAEAFLAADPQWIAYTVYDPATQTYVDRDDPAWSRLSAVADGQVFDFSRTNCCSLRVLTHALQDYGFHVWGAESGIPDPGPEDDFDPTKSPLATPAG